MQKANYIQSNSYSVQITKLFIDKLVKHAQIATSNRNSNHKISLHDPPCKFEAIFAFITPYMHFNVFPFIIIISQLQMQDYGTVLKAGFRPQKKIYNLIPYENRKALVDLVVTEGLSVYRASRVLGIKNTTAKAIMRRFRRQGTIFRRKHQVDNEERPIVKAEPEQFEELEGDLKKEEQAEEKEESEHCNVIKKEEEEGEGKTECQAWRNCGFYICYF